MTQEAWLVLFLSTCAAGMLLARLWDVNWPHNRKGVS